MLSLFPAGLPLWPGGAGAAERLRVSVCGISAGVLSIVGHVFAHYVCHRTSHLDCESLRPFILVREPLVDFGSLVGVATSACMYTPPCMYVCQRASHAVCVTVVWGGKLSLW